MKYNTFIKKSLLSNDIKSLKKYDKLTQKLAKKDKNFTKYLLSSNQNLIKQYGGGKLVKVEQGDKKYEFNVKDFYGEFPKYTVGESNKYVNNVTGRTFNVKFDLGKPLNKKTYSLQNMLHYKIFNKQAIIELGEVSEVNKAFLKIEKVKVLVQVPKSFKISEDTFTFIDVLNKGTYGVICLYQLDSNIDVKFCLKIEKKDNINEIKISQRLRNSNCHTLDVRHITTTDKYNYYIMNALEGNLSKLIPLIKDNINEIKIKLFIAQQVHDQIKCIFDISDGNYIYTDMKLENVLYGYLQGDPTSQLMIYVGDLGGAVPYKLNRIDVYPHNPMMVKLVKDRVNKNLISLHNKSTINKSKEYKDGFKFLMNSRRPWIYYPNLINKNKNKIILNSKKRYLENSMLLLLLLMGLPKSYTEYSQTQLLNSFNDILKPYGNIKSLLTF